MGRKNKNKPTVKRGKRVSMYEIMRRAQAATPPKADDSLSEGEDRLPPPPSTPDKETP